MSLHQHFSQILPALFDRHRDPDMGLDQAPYPSGVPRPGRHPRVGAALPRLRSRGQSVLHGAAAPMSAVASTAAAGMGAAPRAGVSARCAY